MNYRAHQTGTRPTFQQHTQSIADRDRAAQIPDRQGVIQQAGLGRARNRPVERRFVHQAVPSRFLSASITQLQHPDHLEPWLNQNKNILRESINSADNRVETGRYYDEFIHRAKCLCKTQPQKNNFLQLIAKELEWIGNTLTGPVEDNSERSVFSPSDKTLTTKKRRFEVSEASSTLNLSNAGDSAFSRSAEALPTKKRHIDSGEATSTFTGNQVQSSVNLSLRNVSNMASNLTAMFRLHPSAALITASLTKIVVGTIIDSRFQEKLQAEKRYTPQRIAMFVQSLAKLQEAGETLDARALKNLLLALAKANFGEFAAQSISNTVWGLAKLREAGENLDARALENLLAALAKADCGRFKSQEISNTVWGLAKLREAGDTLDARALKNLLSALTKFDFTRFNSQDFSNTVWGLAKLREAGETLDARALKNLLLALAEVNYGEFMPQSISNTVWGLAKLREAGESLDALALKNLLSALAKANCGRFNSQDFSSTIWGLAKLKEAGETLDARALKNLLSALAEVNHGEFMPQSISNTVWGLAKLREAGEILDARALKGLLSALTKFDFTRFNSQDYSNTVWGLAKLREAGETLDARALKSLLSALTEFDFTRFNSQDYSNTVWGLAKLREAGETLDARALQNLLSALAKADCGRSTAQAVSNTVWGLGSLGMIDYQQHIVATTGSTVYLIPWSAQEIANFIWGLAIAAAAPFVDVAKSTDHALEGTLRATAWLDQLLLLADRGDDKIPIRNQLYQAWCVLSCFQKLGLYNRDKPAISPPAELIPDFSNTRCSKAQSQAELLFSRNAQPDEYKSEYALEYKGLTLPPVDIWRRVKEGEAYREYFVEIQGPHHYTLLQEKKIPAGSTVLKRFLYMACLHCLNKSELHNSTSYIYLEIPVEKMQEWQQKTPSNKQDWYTLVLTMLSP